MALSQMATSSGPFSGVAQVVDGNDAGMLEAARDLGLAQEAGVDARVHRLGVRVHLLDGDLAADAFVEAEEHAPDAPGPDLATQRIVLGEADRGRDLLAAAVQTGVEDGVMTIVVSSAALLFMTVPSGWGPEIPLARI